MCLLVRSLGVLDGASGPLTILLKKERNEMDLELLHPALSLSSDTILGSPNLYLEAEISVNEPLEGNRTK